jgi:hypothetical protein
MRLNFLQLILVALWFLFLFMYVLNGKIITSFDNEFSLASLIPVGVVLVIYLVSLISFHTAVTKNLKFLEKVIQPINDGSSNSDWITRN